MLPIELQNESKYVANLHINANDNSVEFIGTVKANSLDELKENARKHARSWNKHLFGRIHVEIDEGESRKIPAVTDFFINP